MPFIKALTNRSKILTEALDSWPHFLPLTYTSLTATFKLVSKHLKLTSTDEGRNSNNICYKTKLNHASEAQRERKNQHLNNDFQLSSNISGGTHLLVVTTCLRSPVWSPVWSTVTFQFKPAPKTLMQCVRQQQQQQLWEHPCSRYKYRDWRVLFGAACLSGSLNIWLQLYLLCHLV